MNAEKQTQATDEGLTPEQRVQQKYRFLKEKIILHYQKGCRILKISKITVAVLFVIFSIVAAILSNRSGTQLEWLTVWIIVIFLNIAVFVPAEYAKYLISSKVIPYLEDEERIEFGEYDIFREDDDEDEEENEEEEA